MKLFSYVVASIAAALLLWWVSTTVMWECTMSGWDCWFSKNSLLQRYQSLIGGIATLFSAFIVYIIGRHQIGSAERIAATAIANAKEQANEDRNRVAARDRRDAVGALLSIQMLVNRMHAALSTNDYATFDHAFGELTTSCQFFSRRYSPVLGQWLSYQATMASLMRKQMANGVLTQNGPRVAGKTHLRAIQIYLDHTEQIVGDGGEIHQFIVEDDEIFNLVATTSLKEASFQLDGYFLRP